LSKIHEATECSAYPANIAARSEMNHSGELKPRIPTEPHLSSPSWITKINI